jgi:hypothetical protein
MIRRLLLTAALSATALVPIVITPGGTAQAESIECGVNYTCLTIYYSTAADTDEVGWLRTTCGFIVTEYGEQTAYSVTEDVASCSSTGPPS